MNIKPETFYSLIRGYSETEGFKVVNEIITSSDPEDGGAYYDIVIEKDGNFYQGSYTDWDVDNTYYNSEKNICDGRVDLDCTFIQVYPKEVKTIVYSYTK